MPPVSSLIFVVILAVWAVYLVQHWVRRRDHLATARSVDRFSESMRVLERRRALPRPDVVEHAPPATSVLLRPARPEVVVKRGATPAPAPAHTVATAVGPTATFRRAQLLARVRAAGLLLGSAVMLTLVVLTITQVLHWGWSFAGLAVLAGTVAAIRWSVARDRTARGAITRRPATRRPATRRPTTRRPAAARRPAGAPGAQEQPARPAPSPLAAQARASVAVHATPARRSVDLDRRPAPVLYDIAEVETALTATAALAQDDAPGTDQAPELPDVASGTWSPVPVPPPTYTLKARAHRAPTGSAQLPLDGTEMALDEEFEELPSVDRVG